VESGQVDGKAEPLLGDGVNVGWILFADSIAGSLIFLSLTGVLLWTQMNRRKMIGATIFSVAVITAVLCAAQSS